MLRTSVSVQPKYLHSGLKDEVHRLVKEKYIGISRPDTGYITSLEIKSITCTGVHKGIPAFNVHFSYYSETPDIGKLITFKVTGVFAQGIFMEKPGMKCMVPSNTLPEWKFSQDKKNYSNTCVGNGTSGVGHVIVIGSEVEVQITGMRYSANIFNCIGKLV